tara:strand:+ start:1554 stop:1856 length:303 start_codon:yes stop_codon:yes gene_type:complete
MTKKEINDILLKMQTGQNCIGETSSELCKLFNIEDKPLGPKYYIGVDCHDNDALAYCMCMNIDNDSTFILMKTMKDKDKFKEEVTNLSRYFNAEICGEID